MQTTLCFDFGNTRLKVAVFNDRDFVEERVLEQANEASIQQLIDQYKPTKFLLVVLGHLL